MYTAIFSTIFTKGNKPTKPFQIGSSLKEMNCYEQIPFLSFLSEFGEVGGGGCLL